MKTLANEIVVWLKRYAENANRKHLVIGVSGGVDSTLVSTLCARTGLPTTCVILPCQSKTAETNRGKQHVNWLQKKFDNVKVEYLNLTTTFEAFSFMLPPNLSGNNLAYANAKSRFRMIALYHVATVVGGLVVGTGNKVEDMCIGFCTKYGDSGVDISPIADLTKTEVRQMSRELGIHPDLSEAVATDGLWTDGRTDEDAIGATYAELEWAMEYRYCWTPDYSTLSERQMEILAIYDKWHNSTCHKFDSIPVFKRLN